MASSSANPEAGRPGSSTTGPNPAAAQGQDQAIASASASGMKQTTNAPMIPRNPQLTKSPYFAYPSPTDEQIEEELPPYFEGENVPLGPLLDRLVRRGYGDLRYLLGEVLPPLSARQRPKPIIEYAKTTRQALIKYLAVVRWKNSVDVASSCAQLAASSHTNNSNGSALTNFPTPHSNGDPNDGSPNGVPLGKGKGKATTDGVEMMRGKVTDARRIAHFMEHQNKQHDDAVEHVKHVTQVVEGLRERNPDLLTALALLTTGTYTRLPTFITEPFAHKPPLTNRSIVTLLRRLNRHIRYRLRCLDYVPSELVVEDIRDGQVHLRGGGEFGWRARMTVVGFSEDSRWWLTSVEWCWRSKQKAVDDPGGDELSSGTTVGKRFEGEERQSILDLANMEVLAPKEVVGPAGKDNKQPRSGTAMPPKSASMAPEGTTTAKTMETGAQDEDEPGKVVDSPLIRIYSFLQHLSLSYQLEVLFTQAMALSQGKRRGQLSVEIDRAAKTLKLKYWIRPRPAQAPQQQQQAAVGRRAAPLTSASAARTPMVGGILSVSLAEGNVAPIEAESLLGGISSGGLLPNERALRMQLAVSWETGELGIGNGLKYGDVMDSALLRIDPGSLNIEDILLASTRAHAAHLTRAYTSNLLSSPRFLQTLLTPPSFREAPDPGSNLPLTLLIPLPSHQRLSNLIIGVSSMNGLIDIQDDGAAGNESRAGRVKMAVGSINEGKTRLADDIGRLTVAVVMENVESQMRQLGWKPTRRLALRSQDLAKAELHPATTVFVPLPSSADYYFVAKVNPQGLAFELLKLARVPVENGAAFGMKLAVGSRTPLELAKLRSRRKGGALGDGSANVDSLFEISNGDLRNLFILSNALLAQSFVEQQLKEKSIPYIAQYPPTSGPGAPRSTSALAGMVPTICVDVRDLLRDGKSGGAAVEVAMPKVGMQIEGWWKGGRCEVTTIVQLRHQSPMAQATTSVSDGSVASSSTATNRSEDISFDPSSSVVKFRAKNIERCVPAFLEQWERLSKVIVVAGEVNRLNKLETFKDVRMLSFDLRTATLRYAEGYNASITYTPIDDSYQVTLFTDRVRQPQPGSATGQAESDRGPVQTQRLINGGLTSPHETLTLEEPKNPHSVLAPLLGARLNELTSTPGESRKRGAVGREFIGLLKGTLPFLLEVETLEQMGWGLVVLGVNMFRIVKDRKGHRYALDVTLLPSLEHYLIQDAHTPRGPDKYLDSFTGQLTSIVAFEESIENVFEAEKTSSSSTTTSPSPDEANGTDLDGPAKIRASGAGARVMPPLMKLDRGRSLVVEVDRIGRVIKSLADLVAVNITKT